ncbi:MAG TPA: Gfo/Idh/MocA family oxidoreductase [Opitutaceae bacterium]|nr:Gfo/Idh/MocA family oxidoreductase [Opitutaceae bacterium]
MAPAAAAPLNFAVIGCGLIGRRRAAAIARAPDTRLRTACDINPARAAEAAGLAPGCGAATDFRAVIADAGVDAVVISTVNASLAPIALAAVRAGKHALVEKPGALGAAELRAVRDAAAAGNVRVRIGYNHRFHPGIMKAREIVDSGALGPLMFIRGRYGHGGRKGYDREWRADPKLSGGGELIDQGVHLIDLASWFLGEFTKVDGHAATYFWDMKVDDNAFLSLRTAAGQTAWLHVSCTEWKNMFSLEIYGRDGKLSVEGLGGSYGTERLIHYRMLPQMGPPETRAWDFPAGDDSWAAETAAFIEDIRRARAPSPGLQEAVRTLEIVESIYKRSGYPTPSP